MKSKPRSSLVRLTAVGALLAASSAHAADIQKAADADALNLGTSWVGGTAPGAGDVALWDN